MTVALTEHLLGILYAHEGRYEEAEEAFLNAVETEPGMAGSCVELGLVYARRGEYQKMAEALRKAIRVGEGGVRAYLGAQPLGDAPNALTDAAAACEGEAIYSSATAAMTYLSQGRDRAAVVVLEGSLRACSARPPVLIALLALTYLLSGEAVDVDEDGSVRIAAPAGEPVHGG